MKNKINKILSLMLLLSMLNGNILSMEKSGIEEPEAQEIREIDQEIQQELRLSGLPPEVIEEIIYPIIRPYEDKIKHVNNIFEFYSQLDRKQLTKDLSGALLAFPSLSWATSSLINRLLKRKYDELVDPIKDQYQGLSKDELNSKLRDILNKFNININDLEEAARLILVGANVNAKNDDGETALILAADYDGKDIVQLKGIVQLLIGKNANVDKQRSDEGDTALMRAALVGHEGIVQLLIEAGANVNAKNDDEGTALMYAAMNGHKGIIQLLINSGANVNEVNKYGDSALTWAVIKGREDIVELLEAAKNK